jgi:hypothetical protein
MIDYLKIDNEVFPLRFSYKVITKHMAKLGLKKFVELERFVNEMPADSMVNFLHDAITAGCAKLDQKPPKVDWLEDNLDFAHVSEALEIFGKQMSGEKKGEELGNGK